MQDFQIYGISQSFYKLFERLYDQLIIYQIYMYFIKSWDMGGLHIYYLHFTIEHTHARGIEIETETEM